ncbi:MAG: PTS transporter subunit EIIC [Solobacterium sp.]|nr:PTS transporter subunit EIIC [Solobacterium sp.]
MKKILVICGAGMTSSILVSRMRSLAAENEELDYKIGSCAANQMNMYVSQADIVFVAPHLEYAIAELKKKDPGKEIILIPVDLYSSLDAEGVFGLLEKKQEAPEVIKVPLWKRLVLGTARLPLLSAISAGFTSMMWIMIIGGILTVLENFPYAPYMEMIKGTLYQRILASGEMMTFGCCAVYLSFLVGYHYGTQRELTGSSAALNSLICFFILIGGPEDMTYFGTKGIFCAIFTAFLSVRIYGIFAEAGRRMIGNVSKLPPQIYDSFISLVPVFFSIIVFTAITGVFTLSGIESFPDLIYYSLQNRMSGLFSSSILSLMFSSLMVQALWFIGIHGGNVVGSVANPILIPLGLENLEAFRAGTALPNIIHHKFSSVCTFGGAGSTLVLAVMMCLWAKSGRMKELGRLSLPMGIFFINEPIIMGLPVMMNPLMLVPFIAVPQVSIVLTYYVMKAGIVPLAVGFEIPWTTPPLINGLIQGGWRLMLWQIILFIIQGMIWYPFLRYQDRKYLEEEHSDEMPRPAAE